ncbi:MAG: hypothetical protein JRF31_04475 [Deltaproteobacteria bacterium]|nr:hypothetical protein [Deltaproteobacteria bacterium]MBW1958566.1 hypothetical protein [Deltaproteobacteria bacterium]MBW2013720.1 hypothetical protein [Deltaproteobacteria bacterium]MBW2089063.1 hypothetical protein [Deltaproteobacteria bacterium]MBW2320102.1 hypothetical protein [Deltaproteobacteria bacterium]
MGVGLRIFIVNDDNSLKRISLKKYERLMKRDPDISFPQYAGKQVRYAEVAIEFENRRPAEILRMEYFIMHFDSKGRIDGTVQDDIMNLGVNLAPPIHFETDPVVIDAQHLFAKKRFDHQFRWKPTPEIEMAILKTIFKTKS